MAIKVDVLPERGLVVVTYWGCMTVDEGLDAFRKFVEQGHAKTTPRHLIDLSRIESFVNPFPNMLRLNADMAAAFLPNEGQTYMAFVAPHPEAQRAASFSIRAWEDHLDRVIPRIFTLQSEALSFLGVQEEALADLARQRPA
ncbi:hypothetical protein PARPLA_01708 [Rhodobacteraceae bacterium THAF1]|uniref:hypothetical protein n=1 Tax=Palleronia sp. THAF1 TaxID=2587842 RepID=UPI000F3E7D0E|nr:hypothetical protein [Palleronia sp. THAF1]QFU09154.1 hypothetical protein FIU81_10765 [Palleronia sp. THAF1]VDC24038.1 hypothetical protein PARPLA_01708 [Rhodobacteraceae bacterium THAF1]